MRVVNEKTIIVDGGTELDQINEELEINLKSKNFNTIAGFLLEKLDRIPKENEKININGIKLEVIKAKRNRVEKVKITK